MSSDRGHLHITALVLGVILITIISITSITFYFYLLVDSGLKFTLARIFIQILYLVSLHRRRSSLSEVNDGTRGLTQWLRAFASLVEDLNSVPTTLGGNL